MRFFIQGEPKPQARPRATKMGKFIKIYSESTQWKKNIEKIAAVYKGEGHYFNEAISVNLYFYFSRPESHYRKGKYSDLLSKNAPEYHIKKPDKDNLEKAVTDALTNGGLLSDDSIIVSGFTSKDYITKDESSGCWVEIHRK